mmetsp:Transcript_33134/g.81336  ORF Transcript_33134/g.81336 Transcript_33134/m.81336 type:complete len:82 (-) Transcript_33134:814-1059(-)
MFPCNNSKHNFSEIFKEMKSKKIVVFLSMNKVKNGYLLAVDSHSNFVLKVENYQNHTKGNDFEKKKRTVFYPRKTCFISEI